MAHGVEAGMAAVAAGVASEEAGISMRWMPMTTKEELWRMNKKRRRGRELWRRRTRICRDDEECNDDGDDVADDGE